MTDTSPAVMTVCGLRQAASLGVTMAHEHVLIDLTCLLSPPTEAWQRNLVDTIPTLQNRGLLYRDPYVSRPNLLLDDQEVATAELRTYRELGGGSIVDLTVHGIGPAPEALHAISESTGVTIIMGCGYYIQRSHPPELSCLDVDALADRLIREIREGVAGTNVRPGIIGELGTSSPIHPDEVKVLRAAAAAQRETGLAVNVHVPIFAQEALHALDILDAAGADLSRVVISHLDEMLDPAYHRAILERGAYVELDTFGSEFYFDGAGLREPSDGERVDHLLRLLADGWAAQLLLSQDVCTRMHLQRYGGFGYGHILRSIVPTLERRGLGRSDIDALLIENPARVLSGVERLPSYSP